MGARILRYPAVAFALLFVLAHVWGLPAATAAANSAQHSAVIAPPVTKVQVADADHTVVQITFPVRTAPQDWQTAADVEWSGIPTYEVDRETGEVYRIAPVHGLHIAVAERAEPTWRVVAVQWYREPEDPSAPVAVVSAPTVYRGVPLAPAVIFPEAGGGLLAGLILEVRHPAPSELGRAESDPVAVRRAAAETIPLSVVNPDHFRQLRTWSIVRAPARAKTRITDAFDLTANWVRLEVAATGIYALGGQELALLGLNLTQIDPAKLRLFKGGGLELAENPEIADDVHPERVGLTEVAIRVEDGGDGEFNADDRLLFYGFGTDVWRDRLDPEADRLDFYNHIQQNRGVYWLTWENMATPSPLPGSPLVVPVIAAPPLDGDVVATHRARYHGEENYAYLPRFLRDRWAWQASINSAFNPTATLYGVLADTAAWQVDVTGTATSPGIWSNPVTVSIWLNNDQAGAVTRAWRQYQDQIGREYLRISGTTTALRNGVNTVYFRYDNFNPSLPNYLAFDSFDLFYRASLDKTAYPGALTSVFWGDEIDEAATPQDIRYVLPATGGVRLWDVSQPGSAVELNGLLADGAQRTLTVGLVRDPGVDRHLVLFANADLLSVAGAGVAHVRPLRQLETVPAADYLVIYPPAFGEAAERLASLRSRRLPGIEAPVAAAVNVEDIYANFSGGQKDWRAIRQYLRWYWSAHGERLRWVCLLGDASRDYRNFQGRDPERELVDWIPTDVITGFPDSFPGILDMTHPYSADGSLVAFDARIETLGPDAPDLAIGRLAANSPAAALALVERMRAYTEEPPPGLWRNHVTFCADDLQQRPENSPTEYYHTVQAESLAQDVVAPSLDVAKAYLVDYPYVGRYKPAARRDLLAALNAGTTMFYYVGHGGAGVLADEQVFLNEFIPGLTNSGRRFVFLAFSCDVGVFDDPGSQSMAELMLDSASGAGIAAIAASWVSGVFANDRFSRSWFEAAYPDRVIDPTVTLGQALTDAKVSNWDRASYIRNNHRYNFFGDPALTLPHPVADLTFAPGSADTLRTGGLHAVHLDLTACAALLQGAAGYQLLVQDCAVDVPYATVSTTRYWRRSGNPVFRGSGQFDAGGAAIPFLAPLNLRTGDDGRIRCIVATDDGDRVAVTRVPVLRAAADTGHDTSGPRIHLSFPGNRLRVQPGAQLQASLFDTSGVNILASNPANSVLLEFNDSGVYSNVSGAVVFAPGSYTRANLTTTLPADLALGRHTVVMTASDMFGNVGADTLRFTLEAGGIGGMRDVTIFPNPTPGPCRLICDLAAPMDLRWDIYTVSGRRVRSLRDRYAAAGPAIIEWDGRDGQGDEIANGVYLYVLRGTLAGAGHEIRQTGQVVIMR
ncbi:MAG: C25 family cysteine peptidase [Candidatus Krumholzibacteria bacterium]|jgi:hypothetical protein|nr:C25 family cysteine peptidase [Candidatus Krumholzibacteria bacterium]